MSKRISLFLTEYTNGELTPGGYIGRVISVPLELVKTALCWGADDEYFAENHIDILNATIQTPSGVSLYSWFEINHPDEIKLVYRGRKTPIERSTL